MKMKAITKKEKAPGVWFEELPIPTIGPKDVLIKPKKVSICGTDVHIYKWDEWASQNVVTPIAIGHEFVGEIVEVGAQVTHLKVGQRVTGEGHITCGLCRNCLTGNKHLCVNTKVIGIHRNGCFAEYLSLPSENIFCLPSTISDDLAAIMDPFGNATHTALSFNLVGEDVLVTGAGPIGIMAAKIATYAGARNVVVTDINEYRLNLASSLGIKTTVNPSKKSIRDVIAQLGIKDGFTVGLEMSGASQAFSSLIDSLQPGGKIALLGILPKKTEIDWNQVIFKMLTIKGIFGREIFSTWYQMTHLLQGGLDLTPIITHHFSFDDYQKGFDVMLSGQAGKVILEF